MNYIKVKPIENCIVDDFIANNSLFALFETPINVLFLDNYIANINKYKDILAHFEMCNNIFFSCKSNKSNAFLKTAAEQGCGIEVSSYYELKDAIKYTNKIIASGPAKDTNYLSLAICSNAIISVDDIEELKDIIKLDLEAKIFLRISDLLCINSRFGINILQIDECLKIIENSKINLIGFSFHINNYNLDNRIQAVEELLDIINVKKLDIKYIDIGGGFPINYCSKKEYDNFIANNNKSMYFKNKQIKDFYPYYNEKSDEQSLIYILENLKSKLNKIEIIIEPGRSLLNNCGISIYKIEYLKHLSNNDNLLITNGNINCLSEQWFNSDYLIEPRLYKKNKVDKFKQPILASVAGNLCLEQDMLTWRKIKFDYLPEKGDYLIYYNTAGYQMDSNESSFHKIPLVKKVIVKKLGELYEVSGDEIYDSK